MLVSNGLETFEGFSLGYLYAQNKAKENEVAQGKNFYAAACLQAMQIFSLATVVGKVAESTIKGSMIWPVRILCNVVPIVTLPVWVGFGAIRQGDYTPLADLCNTRLTLPFTLPQTLDNRFVKVVNFLIDHSGDMIRVAVIVGSCALIAIGQPLFGGACLAALTYQAVDEMGFVPRKVSLFIETHMSVISHFGLLLTSNVLMRAVSLVSLSMMLPIISKQVYYKIDQLVRQLLPINSASLEEIEAPVVERNDPFTAAEICSIVHADSWEYEVNPASCSKWVVNLSNLPVDDDFTKFIPLFDSIAWHDKYPLVKLKLTRDEYFLDYLAKEFSEIPIEEIKQLPEAYLVRLAASKNMTPEQFAANWLREKFVVLVDGLQGKRRLSGSQQDLQDAINNTAKILPCLLALARDGEQAEVEDYLLKLAVEGGDYCSRGVKRATSEVISSVLHNGLRYGSENAFDSDKDYELKIRQALQEQRYSIIQKYFQAIVNEIGAFLPASVQYDVHTFDLYRLYLSFGFYPLTEYERSKFGILEQLAWYLYSGVQERMYREYKLDEAVGQIGQVHLGTYIQRLIESNPKLDDNQKELLLNEYTECNGGLWTVSETNQRFQRLLFVKLGILRKKD